MKASCGLASTGAACSDAVGETIMIAPGARRRITPPVLACRLLRITGVEHTVLGLARFAEHEQMHLARAVVQEAVADSGASRKAERIARTQPVQLAIEPDIRCARDHVHEFLLG